MFLQYFLNAKLRCYLLVYILFLLFYIVIGITHEGIVQEAKKFWNATASLQGAQVRRSSISDALLLAAYILYLIQFDLTNNLKFVCICCTFFLTRF